MLGGISTRWKQIVSYFYIGSSINGSVLKEIILDIINKAKNIVLKVTNITSEMNVLNQKCGSHICVSKFSRKHSIVHPLDKSRKLYFMADPPYILKKHSQVSN